MNASVPTAVRKEMLGRLSASASASTRAAVEACFSAVDRVEKVRSDLRAEPALNGAQRRDALDRIVRDDVFPSLRDAVAPAKALKARFQAERSKAPHVPSTAAVAALNNDAAVIDGALYFAKRAMAGDGGLKPADFDLLTMPGVPA